MAKGRGLEFKTRVDIADSKARLLELKRLIQDVGGISMPSVPSGNLVQANVAMTRAMRDSILETERLRQANLSLQNEWQRGAITLNELNARQRQNTIDRQQATAATRAARLAQQQVNGSYAEAQARLRALGDRIRSVEGGFNNLGRVQQARIAEYRRLNEQLSEFDRRMGNNQRNVGNYQSALRGVGGQLAGLAATYISAAAAIGAVGAAFTQSLKSAAVRTSLEFTFGSVDLADAKLEQLLETANRLGVNYNALTASYKSFTGAVVASNFDFQQGERIFNAVAGAASRLKLSSEDTEGALRALQQMISKGNVQAEELRGQLGERIPGAFSIAARSIGVTESELNKMLQKGEVLAADLLPKLAVELEKTFGLDTTKAVEGLNAETEKFFNIFTGAVSESSNLNKFFTTVVAGFNEIAGTIVKIVNSDSWTEFFVRLTKGSAIADSIKNISKSAEQANKAISNTLNVPANDAKKATFAYEELSLAYENANKALIAYKEGVKKGDLTDGGEFTVKTLENIVKVTKARRDAVKELVKAVPPPVIGETAAEKAAREKAIREAERQLNAQRALQKKITDIQNEAFRKTLTKDEEEIQAVKDKFAKIAEEIRIFNANPKNKLKVDGSGLAPALKAQIVSIEYKQDTEKLKESLEIQKGIYEDFESYRTELGKKAAEERFGSEIDTTKKYADVLQAEYDKILESGSKGGFTGAMTERMKALEGMIRKEGQIEQKRQDDLMKSLVGFEGKVKALEEQYQKERVDVITKGGSAGLAELDKNHKKELAALGDAHLQELDAFKALYDGIDRLSDKNAKQVIGNAEDALNGLKAKGIVISAELEKELKQLFADSKSAIEDRLPTQLFDLANQIDNVADAVGGVDTAFGKVLGTLGNVIAQVGNIKKGINDLNKPGATGIEQLTAGLGIFGAAFSAFKGIANLFGDLNKGAEQQAYARDLQNKQTEAINKALQRQVELIDQVYGVDRILRYADAIKQVAEDEKKYQDQLKDRFLLTGNKQTDAIIGTVNAGGSLPGMSREFVIRSLERGGAKRLPTELEDLRRLLDEGKLDAATAAIVTNLIAANETAIKLANNLKAERIGSSLDSIADSFITTLTDGTQDFGATFEETIEKSIINGFKGELIRKQLQSFYDQFALSAEGGLTAAEIEALRVTYIRAGEQAKKELAELEKITGIKLTVTPEVAPADYSKYQNIATQIISDITNVVKKDGFSEMGNTITDTISNAILEGFQAQMISEGLKEFYDQLAEIQKGGKDITKEQVDSLKEQYSTFITEYNAKLTAIEAATGLSFRKITDLDAEESAKRLEEAKRLAEQQAEDLARLAEQQAEAIRTAIQSLADGLTGIFSGSDKAVKDFMDNFDKLFNDKILANFKETFLADKLGEFYADFAAMTSDGAIPAQAQIAAMKVRYDAIIAAGDAELRRLQEITGQKLIADQLVEEPEPIEVPVEIKVDNSEFEALQDSILSIFSGVDGAIEDSETKFRNMIQKSLENTFKTTYIANALKGFYDQLSYYTNSGQVMTDVQIAALKQQYDTIVKNGQEELKRIERISGFDLSGGAAARGSAIKGQLNDVMTERTANEFVGISRGVYDLTKAVAGNTNQMVIIGRANLNAALATAANTKISADMLVDIQKDIRKMAGASPDQSFRSLR